MLAIEDAESLQQALAGLQESVHELEQTHWHRTSRS